MSKPRRSPVDKLLSYSFVIDEKVTEDEKPLVEKLVSSLTKDRIEASAHLPVPFLHALTHYADTPRALYILTVLNTTKLGKEYWENQNYKDKWGNTVLASLCSRAYFSLADNPVHKLVDQLGGRPAPQNGVGLVTGYLKL
jgi:hypothetical protein